MKSHTIIYRNGNKRGLIQKDNPNRLPSGRHPPSTFGERHEKKTQHRIFLVRNRDPYGCGYRKDGVADDPSPVRGIMKQVSFTCSWTDRWNLIDAMSELGWEILSRRVCREGYKYKFFKRSENHHEPVSSRKAPITRSQKHREPCSTRPRLGY